MRNALAFALLLALALSLTADRSEAQLALMPYIGLNTGESDLGAIEGGFLLGIGAEFALPASTSLNLALRPSAEYQFVDIAGDVVDGSYLQLNADGIIRFNGTPTISPFAGAGLAFGVISLDDGENDESESGIGLNLLGGAEFNTGGAFTPFAQARYTMINIEGEGSDFNAAPEGFAIIGGLVIALGAN